MTSLKYVSSKRINITAFDLDMLKDMSNYYCILLYRLYRCSVYSSRHLRFATEFDPISFRFLSSEQLNIFLSNSIVSHVFNNNYNYIVNLILKWGFFYS